MTVDIPPDLFEFQSFPYEATPEHFVTVTDDREAAVRALVRAGERMYCTDEAGVEHPDDEAANAGGVYAPPSYVADPRVTADGILGYIDCSSAISPEQVAAFRAILKEELEAVGVSATVRNFWYDAQGNPLIGE